MSEIAFEWDERKNKRRADFKLFESEIDHDQTKSIRH
jgi:hypothetical protein